MDNVKHYAERNAEDLGQVFMDHLMAMTAEKLHRKSAIAAELAYRDQRIAELEALVNEMNERIAELEREHNFSHEIAGCTSDNCKASGFECPAAKEVE